MGKDWFATEVESGAEAAVHAEARDEGIEIFAPKLEAWERRRGVNIPVTEPMFPGYVFSLIDLATTEWSRLLRISGCIRLVRGAGAIVAVPDEQIEKIRSRQNKRGAIPVADESLEIGNPVRVINHPLDAASLGQAGIITGFEKRRLPLRDFQGNVIGHTTERIIKVDIMIFGRPTPVEVTEQQVERA